jgi:hypothetical protein
VSIAADRLSVAKNAGWKLSGLPAKPHLTGATMEMIYLGIGAAIYLVFAVWCILAPQN